jgi:hypothetical protein
MMLDTSVLTKVANVCLVDTSGSDMVDTNSLIAQNGLPLQGILKFDDLKFFVEYCHFRSITANVAGSVQSYQAQQLWVLLPELDQVSTRTAGSGVSVDPSTKQKGEDTRQRRVIKRSLVRGLAPPEHGGTLNLPVSLRDNPKSAATIKQLQEKIADGRRKLGLPDLETYYVNPEGQIV